MQSKTSFQMCASSIVIYLLVPV